MHRIYQILFCTTLALTSTIITPIDEPKTLAPSNQPEQSTPISDNQTPISNSDSEYDEDEDSFDCPMLLAALSDIFR